MRADRQGMTEILHGQPGTATPSRKTDHAQAMVLMHCMISMPQADSTIKVAVMPSTTPFKMKTCLSPSVGSPYCTTEGLQCNTNIRGRRTHPATLDIAIVVAVVGSILR